MMGLKAEFSGSECTKTTIPGTHLGVILAGCEMKKKRQSEKK